MTQKLVVIGAGMASGRAIELLLERHPDLYQVTLFGAAPRGNYNRIMLSPVLSGEKSYDDIVTHDAVWYADHNVTCRFGETVTKIDRARKVVISATGETPYDKLLIATGSAPFAKVGLPWVQARVVQDQTERAALMARFDLSQTVYQKDPWAERSNAAAMRAFAPMADLTLEAAE